MAADMTANLIPISVRPPEHTLSRYLEEQIAGYPDAVTLSGGAGRIVMHGTVIHDDMADDAWFHSPDVIQGAHDHPFPYRTDPHPQGT